MREDPEQRIGRPRQIYTGATQRDYIAVDRRTECSPTFSQTEIYAPYLWNMLSTGA